MEVLPTANVYITPSVIGLNLLSRYALNTSSAVRNAKWPECWTQVIRVPTCWANSLRREGKVECLHTKFHLNVFIVLASGSQKPQFLAYFDISGGSCTGCGAPRLGAF